MLFGDAPYLGDMPALRGLLALSGLVLGAVIGSFMATLALRWPAGRGVAHGRSACDHCGAALGPADLVPLFSYVVLRGRCRRCGGIIHPLHPLIELSCALCGGAAFLFLPPFAAMAWAIFCWLLIPLAVLDARHFWLPDRLVLALGLAGLMLGEWPQGMALPDRLIGGALGFALLWLLGWGFGRLRGVRGLGGGDPKLLGALGLWVGWQGLPLLLLLASLAGLVMAVAAMLMGRERRREGRVAVPFGTMLAMAAPVVLLLPMA